MAGGAGIFMTDQNTDSKSSLVLNNVIGTGSSRSVVASRQFRGSSMVENTNKTNSSSTKKRFVSNSQKPLAITDKPPNPDQQSVKDIISKVRRMRGSNPINSKLQTISEQV